MSLKGKRIWMHWEVCVCYIYMYGSLIVGKSTRWVNVCKLQQCIVTPFEHLIKTNENKFGTLNKDDKWQLKQVPKKKNIQ